MNFRLNEDHLILVFLFGWMIWTEFIKPEPKSPRPDTSLIEYLEVENSDIKAENDRLKSFADSINEYNEELENAIIDDAIYVRNASESELDSLLTDYLETRRQRQD